MNFHDFVDKVGNAVNETTFGDAISYLPGGFKGVSPAIKTIAKMKKHWAVNVEESGDDAVVHFEDQLRIKMPKSNLKEFSEQAFNGCDLGSMSIVELHPSLCDVSEATAADVETDELVVLIGDKLLHAVRQGHLAPAYENVKQFKAAFQGKYRTVTVSNSAIRLDDDSTFTKDLQQVKDALKQAYAGDRGGLEMVLAAVEDGGPLGMYEVLSKYKNIYAFQAEVSSGNLRMSYQWSVDSNHICQQVIALLPGPRSEAVLKQLSGVQGVKVAGSQIFPEGGVFKRDIFRDMLQNGSGATASESVQEGHGEPGRDVSQYWDVSIRLGDKWRHVGVEDTKSGPERKQWALRRAITSLLHRSKGEVGSVGLEISKIVKDKSRWRVLDSGSERPSDAEYVIAWESNSTKFKNRFRK